MWPPYKFLLLVFMVFNTACSVIRPGEAGVVFNRTTGSLSSTGQGAVFYVPFLYTVEAYPTALRTYSMVARNGEGSAKDDDSIDLPSLESQHIRMDISVTYNTSPEKAAEVYKSFNGEDISDIERTFIRRTVITAAQAEAGKMPLTELMSSKRDDLQAAIQNKLSIELAVRGFHVDNVNLGAAHLPQAIEAQMQAKMAKQQEAQQAEYTRQKEVTLALALEAQAHGIANANRIIQASLTSAVLENKRIDKWDGVLPTVSGASNLMINLNHKD